MTSVVAQKGAFPTRPALSQLTAIRQAVVCQLFRAVKLAAVDRSAISDILDG
ncbi:hypothetical protein [Verrucosispora sioxanthis]|uniref:hypothetical protein n=1 Tax=Verrucosispora sioxanthis TaxID=2499994 RepID=UPI001C1221E6|nr:hypothetical protein [Verrucosispora sioxanthis]